MREQAAVPLDAKGEGKKHTTRNLLIVLGVMAAHLMVFRFVLFPYYVSLAAEVEIAILATAMAAFLTLRYLLSGNMRGMRVGGLDTQFFPPMAMMQHFLSKESHRKRNIIIVAGFVGIMITLHFLVLGSYLARGAMAPYGIMIILGVMVVMFVFRHSRMGKQKSSAARTVGPHSASPPQLLNLMNDCHTAHGVTRHATSATSTQSVKATILHIVD